MPNLRVVHNNLIDVASTTITASSTASAATIVANLKTDPKSVVWRSGTSSTIATKANLLIVPTSITVVGALILAFTNLSAEATLRLRGFIGTAPTLTGTVDVPVVSVGSATTVFDTGYVVGNPPQGLGNWEFGDSIFGPNAQESRRGYSKVWVPQTQQAPCTSMVLEIVDPYNTNQYIEASRLIVGTYWSPTYNTSYGVTTSIVDMSSNERTESGDLVTSNGAYYSKLSFDLKYMDKKDRTTFNSIIRSKGMRKPVFISIFPEDADTGKDQVYQIYGKLSQLYGIEHPIFEMYSSQVEVEEI